MRAAFLLIMVAGLVLRTHSEVKSHPVVHCETTQGPLTIEVYPEWSPIGAERFLALVADEFYTNIALYRCVKRFLVQFGISDNPIKKHWHGDNIPDDPNIHKGIKKHYLSFAGGGPNTRSTQLFIAFEDLDFLGREPWETPFGKVIEGADTLDKLYKGYGDIPPFGNGPDQQLLYSQGNAYIRAHFPRIDFIQSCSLVDEEPLADLAEMEQFKGRDGFVPEDDDDRREADSRPAEEEPLNEEEPVADVEEPFVQEEESHEMNDNSIQSLISKKERGNLREELIIVEKEMEGLIARNETVAQRALLVLAVALLGMLGFNKYYSSSSSSTIGKAQ